MKLALVIAAGILLAQSFGGFSDLFFDWLSERPATDEPKPTARPAPCSCWFVHRKNCEAGLSRWAGFQTLRL